MEEEVRRAVRMDHRDRYIQRDQGVVRHRHRS